MPLIKTITVILCTTNPYIPFISMHLVDLKGEKWCSRISFTSWVYKGIPYKQLRNISIVQMVPPLLRNSWFGLRFVYFGTCSPNDRVHVQGQQVADTVQCEKWRTVSDLAKLATIVVHLNNRDWSTGTPKIGLWWGFQELFIVSTITEEWG